MNELLLMTTSASEIMRRTQVRSHRFDRLLLAWSAALTFAEVQGENRRRPMVIHTIGIDLGKTVFHLSRVLMPSCNKG